jgi:AbiV family abortive infection protein
MSKKFSTLSRPECKPVSKDIMMGSDASWESGLLLANNNRFGHAVPYLIASVEELVKSLILLFDSEGFQFRNTKGVDTFFRNHQIRFVIAYAMFSMNIFGEEFIRFLKQIREKPQDFIKLYEEMKVDEKSLNNKIKIYVFRKLILLRNEFEWFSKLDLLRQEGFYSSYDGELKTPLQVNQQDYEQIKIRLGKIRMVAKFIFESFESADDSMKKHINKLRIDFKKNGIYSKITNLLASIKKDREGPFIHIRKLIEKDIT